MDKIAEAAAYTAFSAVQATTGFAEIRHRRQFAVYRPAGIPARIECVARFLTVLLVFKPYVDVADEICSVQVSRCSTKRSEE